MTAQISALLQDALGPDYRLEQELEGGGMSRLFLATDLRLGRRVVVKVLSPELTSAADAARFRREIELTVRVQHPHILPILTSGSWADGLYYVAPFIPGESLRARIDRERKLPLDEIVKILQDVSDALAFAHQRSIVHRDVKPGNILLADGHAILADFGIARAVSTTATPLTGSGMTPGTPAYMAPELPTDERADVYALGVVAYEMLCGGLPGRGATAREIVVARGAVAGDSGRRLRALARLISVAISPRPELRLGSAAAMHERLRAIALPTAASWSIVIVAAAIAAAVAIAVPLWNRLRPTTLNPNRYVVLSLGSVGPLDAQLVEATADALAEWQGLTAIDAAKTAASTRGGSRALLLEDVGPIARSLDAANVIAVEGRRVGDSIEVRATLSNTDSVVKTERAAFVADAALGTRRMTLRRLVNGLLRDGAELPWHDAVDAGRPVLSAWRAYDAGRAELRQWKLAEAESQFRRAIEEQATIVPAHLWLSQTLMWMPAPRKTQDMRAGARAVLDARPAVGTRDSLRAAALLALSEERYDAACAAFSRIVVADSSDLSGWLGLGDCRAFDPIVERAAGGGGWRFRGSFEAAARAYQRARDIGASTLGSDFEGWVLGRLSHVLYTITNQLRLGHALPPEAENFAAYPYLDHDSIAFTPRPMAEIASSGGPPFSAVQGAIARNRAVLRQAAESWVQRAPRDPAAYDTLARWTEVSGGLALVGERQVPTLDVLRRAIELSRDSTDRLRLAIAETRVLVKTGAFARARAEADSLLRSGAAARNGTVAGVAGLAVLVGRVEETATLLATAAQDSRIDLPNGTLLTLPAQLLEADARLTTYASFGVSDSVPTLARRTMELVRSYFPDTTQAQLVQGALVFRPLTLAYPAAADVMAAIAVTPDANAGAYAALARGDSAGARVQLAKLRRLASGVAPGTAIENNLRRARLALFLGDSAAAVAELDPVLRALPTLGPFLLVQVPQVTAVVRGLALRAELADRAGDRRTAMECAAAVIALWSDADPVLQPVVARMKQLMHGAG